MLPSNQVTREANKQGELCSVPPSLWIPLSQILASSIRFQGGKSFPNHPTEGKRDFQQRSEVAAALAGVLLAAGWWSCTASVHSASCLGWFHQAKRNERTQSKLWRVVSSKARCWLSPRHFCNTVGALGSSQACWGLEDMCEKGSHRIVWGWVGVFFFNKPTLLAWGGEAEHPEKDLIAQWAGQGSPAHERSCPGPWLPDCEIKERDELLPSVNVFRTGHQSNTAPQKLPLLACICPYSLALWQNQRIGEVGKDH